MMNRDVPPTTSTDAMTSPPAVVPDGLLDIPCELVSRVINPSNGREDGTDPLVFRPEGRRRVVGYKTTEGDSRGYEGR